MSQWVCSLSSTIHYFCLKMSMYEHRSLFIKIVLAMHLASFFVMLVIFPMYSISHKHLESVISISNLSSTHLGLQHPSPTSMLQFISVCCNMQFDKSPFTRNIEAFNWNTCCLIVIFLKIQVIFNESVLNEHIKSVI